jgi:spermidine/putrescine transport system substrate-binding protein
LLSGDLLIAHGWSGEFARARTENPHIRYVIPQEGGVIWTDNLAIPRARAIARSPSFYRFSPAPTDQRAIVNFLRYPHPKQAARPFILPEILADPAIYPPEEILDKLEWIQDVGDAIALYERVWDEVKTR